MGAKLLWLILTLAGGQLSGVRGAEKPVLLLTWFSFLGSAFLPATPKDYLKGLKARATNEATKITKGTVTHFSSICLTSLRVDNDTQRHEELAKFICSS